MIFMELEDREVLVFVLALLAIVAMIKVAPTLGPARRPALGALIALVVALAATNIEELVPESIAVYVNLLEHLAYLTHTLFLLSWVLIARRRSLQA